MSPLFARRASLPHAGNPDRLRSRIARMLLLALVIVGGAFGAPAIASAADVSISLEPMLPLDVGYTEQFNLDVINNGPGNTATATVVTSTVPSTLTFVSVGGAGWSCSQSASFSCIHSGSIGVGVNAPLLLQAIPTAAAVPTASFQFSAGVAGDTNPANNTFSIVEPVHFFDDVAVSIGHTGTWEPGSNETIRIGVTNVGDDDTDLPISITDQLPPGVTYVSSTGTNWSCAADANQLVTCSNQQSKASGTVYTALTLKVLVGAQAAPGVTSAVTVHYSPDQNPANDTASESIPVPYLMDLGISFAPPASMAVGQTGTLSFPIGHAGRGPTTGATTFAAAIPPQLHVTAVAGSGWTCAPASQNPTCTAPAPKSAFQPVVVSVVPTVAAPSVGVSASVATDGDLNPVNNGTSGTFAITPSCVVPGVVGMNAGPARGAMAVANCGFAASKRIHKRRGWKQVVTSQSKRAGTVLPVGTVVYVSVKWKKKHG